ncbi:MAG TPA: hypothetical protein PK760_10825, partial [Flavobacteriales bacterium]|nr:hypothetical protein [Flavobacteriales bacterium]
GSDAPFALFSALTGSPDAGGSWFDPNGLAVENTFDPALQVAGTYTYILFVPAPCMNDTSEVLMNVVAPPDAGLDGSATMCSEDAALTLFNLLNGTPDAGGAWTGPSDVADGLFDPHFDVAGDFTYTVQATAPCVDMSALVNVVVNPLPDAGDNGSITLCPEAAPVDLFSLLGGTPMPGGTWTGPGGVASNGTFDPSTNPQGVYTYTVTGLLPCPNAVATSTATIFIIAPPNAGPNAVSCTLEFTLNATGNWASGTWTGPAGIVFADPTSPNSTVTATAGGSYTFTWTVLSNDGCSTQDDVTITFSDPIVPVVATVDAICNGACNGTASVATTGGNGAYSYVWSNGIAGNTPTATGICAGDYSVTVSDVNNCNSSMPFHIGEPNALQIDAIIAEDESCPGECDGEILVVDPQGAQYSINGGDSFQGTALFTGLCPGDFDIVMQDANGCLASGTASINAAGPVVAGFTYSPDTLLVSDPTVDFTNASSPNASSFTWDFAGLGTSSDPSPSYTFPGVLGDSYLVCLTVASYSGCTDSICSKITILD